jgi:hypothetical protein
MRPFKRNPDKTSAGTPGDVFEQAAGEVTATTPTPEVSDTPPEGAVNDDRLTIRTEWADYVSHLAFVPASKLLHPAYALTDEEAAILNPKMEVFLQDVADKYAPALLARLTNKYPALFDIFAAIAVLHFQKMKLVKEIRAEEAKQRAEKEAEARAADSRTLDTKPLSSVPS